MAKLIVQDGKLCTLDGRLVTDTDGAPCVCGDEGPCDNGCGLRCNGPGCFLGASTNFPDCIDVELIDVANVGSCPHGAHEDTLDIVTGIAGVHRLQSLGGAFPDRYFAEIDALVVRTHHIVSGGSPFTTVNRGLTIEVTLRMCISSGGQECLYVGTIGTSGLGATVYQFTGSPVLPVQNILRNNSGEQLGCAGSSDDETEIRADWAQVTVPTNCDPITRLHFAQSCDGADQIVVDLATYPDDDVFLPKLDGVLYQITSQQTELPETPGYEWVVEQCPESPRAQADHNPPPPRGISLFEWGRLIKEAIRVLRLTRFAPEDCTSCKKREILMDHFGRSVGRALARIVRRW